MKELSTEEKARSYDKLREKIALRFGSNVAEEIFSVFEESEDEKTRTAILELVRQSSEILEKKNQEQMIAWLEKQGDANKEYWRGYREGKQEILDKYAEFEKQGKKPQGKTALEAAKEERLIIRIV